MENRDWFEAGSRFLWRPSVPCCDTLCVNLTPQKRSSRSACGRLRGWLGRRGVWSTRQRQSTRTQARARIRTAGGWSEPRATAGRGEECEGRRAGRGGPVEDVGLEGRGEEWDARG